MKCNQDSQKYPSYQWWFALCQSDGGRTEGTEHYPGVYQHDHYTRTALYRAFELVRIEARRYGVTILGSEIVGLVPMEALIDTASYYLGLENFSMRQVLESV